MLHESLFLTLTSQIFLFICTSWQTSRSKSYFHVSARQQLRRSWRESNNRPPGHKGAILLQRNHYHSAWEFPRWDTREHRIRSIQNDQQAIRDSSVIFVAPYWSYRISCLKVQLAPLAQGADSEK